MTLQVVLDCQIADGKCFRKATGGSVRRASQRLTEIIDDQLRDRTATVTAGQLPTNLAAIKSAVIAASQDPAAQLGVALVNFRFSE